MAISRSRSLRKRAVCGESGMANHAAMARIQLGRPSTIKRIRQEPIDDLAWEMPYANAPPYALANAAPERKMPVRRPSFSRG